MNLQENIDRIKQVMGLLTEEYSQKVVNQLIDKFKRENPEVDIDTLKDYINRFDQIKNGPNIVNKDISTYTFNELESVVIDSMTNIKPKSYKGDSDLDLVYRGDGLTIFLADEKEKCIKYGNGYSFCISSYGDDNRYGDYRYDAGGTPYFIFNSRLSTKKYDDNDEWDEYLDPDHLLVLFVYTAPPMQPEDEYVDYSEDKEYQYQNMSEYYSITEAGNRGERYYMDFNTIETYYPHLKGLKNVFIPKKLSEKDEKIIAAKEYGEAFLKQINRGYKKEGTECDEYLAIFEHYDFLFTSYNDSPWAYNKYPKFLDAYKNGYREFYTVLRPVVHTSNFTIRHSDSKVFFGTNALEEAKKFIDFATNHYVEELKKTEESGNDHYSIAEIKPSIDKKNYFIKKCEWSPEYTDYMKQIYNLKNKVIHMNFKAGS
jgi:hypothetical protein